MLFEVESAKSLEQIGRDLEAAALRHRFGLLIVHDLQEKMREKGVEMDRQVRIFEVCNPKQAKEALDVNPLISTVLPCRIAVFSTAAAYKLATMLPSAMMTMFGEKAIEHVAAEVERTLVSIMKEAAE